MKKDPNLPQFCDMRGLLSFYMLWLLSWNSMCGEDIAEILRKKRGEKPNPGTIYPALKKLQEAGLVRSKRRGRRAVYIITDEGRSELHKAARYFMRAYGELFKYYSDLWDDSRVSLR